MSQRYQELCETIRANPQCWLVTGVAGFIGSNLLEALLNLNQVVVGIDNLSTGSKGNLIDVKRQVSDTQWKNFQFVEADIREESDIRRACVGVDHVLHQAALGSVPRSIHDPITTNSVNVVGFLNVLQASCDADVKSFTYAASSSTYGDSVILPKEESTIGNLLSPYAVTKYVNELYARTFAYCYGFNTIGLRYFNVFGKRQDPNGAYSAVIPRWLLAMLENKSVTINGDGLTSRDFCFVDNVIQANILSAFGNSEVKNEVYNIAVGGRTSLNELYTALKDGLERHGVCTKSDVLHAAFRSGDVRHSQASIKKAQAMLQYEPTHDFNAGIRAAIPWYIARFGASNKN